MDELSDLWSLSLPVWRDPRPTSQSNETGLEDLWSLQRALNKSHSKLAHLQLNASVPDLTDLRPLLFFGYFLFKCYFSTCFFFRFFFFQCVRALCCKLALYASLMAETRTVYKRWKMVLLPINERLTMLRVFLEISQSEFLAYAAILGVKGKSADRRLHTHPTVQLNWMFFSFLYGCSSMSHVMSW